MTEPLRQRLAVWLRTWADRIDDRAHREADSAGHDPIKEEVMRLLDALDSGDDPPPGWSLGGSAGREQNRD